jgi:hypothetical protein
VRKESKAAFSKEGTAGAGLSCATSENPGDGNLGQRVPDKQAQVLDGFVRTGLKGLHQGCDRLLLWYLKGATLLQLLHPLNPVWPFDLLEPTEHVGSTLFWPFASALGRPG